MNTAERDVLAALIHYPDLIVSKDSIEGLVNNYARGYANVNGAGVVVDNLRDKLGARKGHRLIYRTGQGYSLNPSACNMQNNPFENKTEEKLEKLQDDKMLLWIAHAERKYLPTDLLPSDVVDFLPRLSLQEQTALIKQIQVEIAAIRRLDEEWVFGAERDRLISDIAIGASARQHLVVGNLALVKWYLFKYLIPRSHVPKNGTTAEDSIQEGSKGLMRSVLTYDPNRGAFSTYATVCIRQSILRAIDNSRMPMTVPIHLQESTRRLERAIIQFEDALGRNPTPAEIAEKLQSPAEEVEEIYLLTRQEYLRFSQHTFDPEKGEATIVGKYIEDSVADSAVYLQGESHWAAARQKLDEIFKLAGLKKRTVKVLKMRFGLAGDGRVYALEEVAPHIGVTTRERVRQLQNAGLKKIKKYLAANPDTERELRSYLHYFFD